MWDGQVVWEPSCQGSTWGWKKPSAKTRCFTQNLSSNQQKRLKWLVSCCILDGLGQKPERTRPVQPGMPWLGWNSWRQNLSFQKCLCLLTSTWDFNTKNDYNEVCFFLGSSSSIWPVLNQTYSPSQAIVSWRWQRPSLSGASGWGQLCGGRHLWTWRTLWGSFRCDGWHFLNPKGGQIMVDTFHKSKLNAKWIILWSQMNLVK